MDKKTLRSKIFRHLDGIATAPVVHSLHQKKVVDFIFDKKKCELSEICSQFPSNEGYMNVALRILASQGFLEYEVNNTSNIVEVQSNENTEKLLEYASLYNKVIPFLKEATHSQFQNFELASFSEYAYLLDESVNNFGYSDAEIADNKVLAQILKHIEGCIAGPIIVQLGMRGMFHKYFMETSFQAGEFHKNEENFEKILDFLTDLGWFTKNQNNYRFTETGEYFAKRAASYGVTVSYLPMFNQMDEILFGNSKKMRGISNNEDEIHVDRKMNVWGSGGAHSN